MTRRFSAIWRTCDPLVSMALLAAVSAMVLSARNLPWRGEWMWTLDWAAGTTILAGPLTAGLAAYESGRWRSATAALILPSARRRVAACFLPALAVLASAAVVYVLGTVVVLAVSGRYHPSDRPVPVLWLIGLCELAVCTAMGWLVGSRLPAYVAAPLATAGCYVLVVVASTHSALAFWLVGGSTGPSTGQVIDARYSIGAALSFLGLAALSAALYMVQRSPTRRVAQIGGAVAIGVIASARCWARLRARRTTESIPTRTECVAEHRCRSACWPATRPSRARGVRK